MEIEEFLRTLAPGERVTMERIASATSLTTEEVEHKLKSIIKANPDLVH